MSVEPRAIATPVPAAYLRRVSPTRFFRYLTILALALSPLATFVAGPASATAHHAAMVAEGHRMAGHDMPGHAEAGDAPSAATPLCDRMGDQPMDGPCESDDSDCVKACAAVPAISAAGGQLEAQVPGHGLQRRTPAVASARHGLVPEAATPPPRSLLKI